jgi:T5SS/PEP-CTERM-associated repeat protein/autotransporter-associated beta strand protein
MAAFSILRRPGCWATSLVPISLVLTMTPSSAVEFWTGAASTDWFNAGNWTVAVPTNTASTRIDTVTPNATVIGTAGALATGLRVGVATTGALTIQNGGTVNNTLGIIADGAGSTGTATVDGAGSRWTNSSDFYVGHFGNGTLTVSNGGAVSNVYGFIGRYSSSTSTATVDGAGSTWTSADLNVGYAGSGTLTIRNGGTASNVGGYLGIDPGATGAVTVDGAGSAWTNSGYLYVGNSGSGTLSIRNGGAVSSNRGSIALQAGSTGTLNIGAASGQAAVAPGTLNTASVNFGDGTGQIVFNHTATNYVFAAAVTSNGAGSGTVRVEAGTTILTATNTYTRATIIDGGTLSVNGSIAGSAVTVNAGGTLGGNGTVGNTIVNGGTLAPGNSIGLLTVNGNLSFSTASSYRVEVASANADRVNVTGTATLSGATVNASFAVSPGSQVAKQYTILNAGGGLGGSTFGSVVNTNLPSGFKSSLSYDANNAYLNLALNFAAPPGGTLNVNQQGVGNALVSFFNRGGGIPLAFGGLTGPGLTQISGESAAGSQQATFDAMTQFMGVMTDPFTADRGGEAGVGAAPFAEEGFRPSLDTSPDRSRSPSERDAYAAIYRKTPLRDAYDPRWSVWAAGFGGSQTTDGNAALGSNTATSRVFGLAMGADYLLSPRTIAGFALAGGGTNFSVANGGSGRSDLFQAGAFIKHKVGAAYITAAAAYGWQDITTDRTVTIAGIDRLHANFKANAFSGRIEGGNRYVLPWMGGMGLTPYAAAQVTAFDLPAYGEGAISGANTFALSYGAKTVAATRGELGLRSDKSLAVNDAILTLRGRAAWAHDFNPDRSLATTFQTLPGASFVVSGAAQARDSALVTAAAEMKWLTGFSLAATFDGAFSDVTRSYAGKGVARYNW